MDFFNIKNAGLIVSHLARERKKQGDIKKDIGIKEREAKEEAKTCQFFVVIVNIS